MIEIRHSVAAVFVLGLGALFPLLYRVIHVRPNESCYLTPLPLDGIQVVLTVCFEKGCSKFLDLTKSAKFTC